MQNGILIPPSLHDFKRFSYITNDLKHIEIFCTLLIRGNVCCGRLSIFLLPFTEQLIVEILLYGLKILENVFVYEFVSPLGGQVVLLCSTSLCKIQGSLLRKRS